MSEHTAGLDCACQDCYECIFAESWTEPHGEKVARCSHPKRNDGFWGEESGDDRHGECPYLEAREAVRCAVNGVVL